jgi:glycosyltransferase involved in cell wall biosynthesis
MKIVIVGTAYPLRGGIAHFNALLASHLRNTHQVETVTFKRQYPKFLFPGKSQDEQGTVSEEFGVSPAPQIVDSINPFNWVTAARKIAALKPDLLIFKYWMPFFGPCFGTIARLVKRACGSKVLFICDNVIPHERRPGDVAFTKYAFRKSDYFIVLSNSVEQDLLKYFPQARYRKVAHPIYEIFGQSVAKTQAREKLGITTKHVVLFFGYVRKYKGLMVLLDAMKEFYDNAIGSSNKDLADVTLLVVGEFYDDEAKYREKVKELNIGNIVRFVSDYVPNDQVGVYFGASDVVVLPYLSATQSGIVQIAYNFDRPVIATDVGGLSEVVLNDKTGFIVNPDNSTALSAALKKFYLEQREEEFRSNIVVEKKKYSWETFIRAIEELAAE